jgi:hypothetical protein
MRYNRDMRRLMVGWAEEKKAVEAVKVGFETGGKKGRKRDGTLVQPGGETIFED